MAALSSETERPWLLDGADRKRKRFSSHGGKVSEKKVGEMVLCPGIEEVDGTAGFVPVPPSPPPVREKKDTIAQVYLETNRVFLQFLLVFLFSKESVFRDQVYKKWSGTISSACEEMRDKDLVRILMKIASCKGSLEIGDKYIQIFDEGDRRLPEEQELHLPGDLVKYAAFTRPVSVLKQFCTRTNTEYIMGHKIHTNYKYDGLLTQLLDSARVCILKGFVDHFILHHNTRRFYGQSERLAAQHRCTRRVLDTMLRDTTIDLPHPLFITAEELLGINMQHSPMRDGLLHYNVDPDVARMIKKAKIEESE